MLEIQDLVELEDLDRDAMQAVAGGWGYRGAKSGYDNEPEIVNPNPLRLLDPNVLYGNGYEH